MQVLRLVLQIILRNLEKGHNVEKVSSIKGTEIYKRINPYEGFSYSRPSSAVSKVLSLASELKSDVFKRNYRRFEHHDGVGLHFSTPEAILEVSDSLAKKTKMITIHSSHGATSFDVNNLKSFSNLRDVRFGHLVTPVNISSLPYMGKLKSLVMEMKVKETIPFSDMKALEELWINGQSNLKDIKALSKTLNSLTVYNLKNSDEIINLKKLKYLKIVGAQKEKNLEFLSNFQYLEVLILNNLLNLISTKGINNSPKVTHLVIEKCKSLELFEGINKLTKLCFIELRKCLNISNLESFNYSKSLTDLYIFNCPLIAKEDLLKVVGSQNIERYFHK